MFSWCFIVRKAYRSGSKIFLLASAAFPPVAVAYDLLTWSVGLMDAVMSQGCTAVHRSAYFTLLVTNYWRVPIYRCLEILNIPHEFAPYASSSLQYLSNFPAVDEFHIVVMGFTNETSIVCMITVFAIWVMGLVQSRWKRNGT